MDKLNDIIEQLIVLGEDRDELEFWRTVYPSLEPDKQRELIENLSQELAALQKPE